MFSWVRLDYLPHEGGHLVLLEVPRQNFSREPAHIRDDESARLLAPANDVFELLVLLRASLRRPVRMCFRGRSGSVGTRTCASRCLWASPTCSLIVSAGIKSQLISKLSLFVGLVESVVGVFVFLVFLLVVQLVQHVYILFPVLDGLSQSSEADQLLILVQLEGLEYIVLSRNQVVLQPLLHSGYRQAVLAFVSLGVLRIEALVRRQPTKYFVHAKLRLGELAD